tara:strand:+ start:627 stop:1055 length:429 start_codon:yes stop_codon:yes gene_type:complete
MGNLRDLKAFVRYDGSGRVVAGSLIFRRKKPTIGNFQQIQAFKCCNVDQTPVFVSIDSEFPIGNASIGVGPNDGDFYQPLFSYSGDTAADIDELAVVFNANYPNLGFFNVVDGDLYWTPSIQIAEFYAANHTTALYAYAFND